MNILSTHFYFLSALAVALLALAIWIYYRYQKGPSILYLCGFLLGLSLIAAVSSMIFLPLSETSLLLLARLGYVAGVLTFSMLLMFSWYFPIPSAKIPRNDILWWVIPLSFFVPYALLSPVLIQAVEVTDRGLQELPGSGYWVFPVFVIAYYVLALKNFFQKFRYTSGKEQKNLRVFVIALIIAAFAGTVFDVIIPAITGTRVQIGIYTAGALFGISAYIVMKK